MHSSKRSFQKAYLTEIYGAYSAGNVEYYFILQKDIVRQNLQKGETGSLPRMTFKNRLFLHQKQSGHLQLKVDLGTFPASVN